MNTAQGVTPTQPQKTVTNTPLKQPKPMSAENFSQLHNGAGVVSQASAAVNSPKQPEMLEQARPASGTTTPIGRWFSQYGMNYVIQLLAQ